VVASSALKKADVTEDLRDEAMIDLEQSENMTNEERRA
jgi:hypothetical protein